MGALDSALAEDVIKGLDVSALKEGSGLTGRFYSKKSFPRTPSWAKYVEPVVDGGVQGVQSASSSGLMLLKVDGNAFALTFGYGRTLLDQAKIERRFGLKVALNLIDERQIRSLDTKKFDEMVVSTNTQTSRTAELPTFGVDIIRDILRAVTGIAPAGSGYKSLSGADALVLGVDKAVEDLPHVLRDLYAHFKATKYQATFGWVDHLAEVKDPLLVSRLDGQLLDQLRLSDTTTTHMAMPENLDWEDIEHFVIVPTKRQRTFDELDLDDYLAEKACDAANITIERLKSRKVSVKFLSSADPVARWSIYHCLVSEQRIDEKFFALVEGRWFEVAGTLVKQVDAAVQAIPSATVSLPPGWPGETEGAYNKRAAAECADLALLDTKLVAPDGAHTKIEFCDLLSKDGSLVHVKRKSRSSTLSHLFAQGHVSAEAMVDGVLRDQVRAAITKAVGDGKDAPWLDIVPPGTADIERDKLNVTYAVIANSKAAGTEWLPFFSRLTLMQTARDLNRMGFTKLSLVRVPVEASDVPPDDDDRGVPASAD
ncbi:TIGR04141 family sporadically distributed protein [Mumia sp. ZJ1417]|nr:TIGR04141 family sporadically distributed protein [Mumia sp. ZJ1417]